MKTFYCGRTDGLTSFGQYVDWKLHFLATEERNSMRADSTPSDIVGGNGVVVASAENSVTDRSGILTNSAVNDSETRPEVMNKKAISIINRVRDKLTGKLKFGRLTFGQLLGSYPGLTNDFQGELPGADSL